MQVTKLTLAEGKTFDEAAIQAMVTDAPVAYTMQARDLPEDDFILALRIVGRQVCVWPDGQLDIVGEA